MGKRYGAGQLTMLLTDARCAADVWRAGSKIQNQRLTTQFCRVRGLEPTVTEMNPADGPHAPAMRALTALGRHGKPDEVGAAVALLASPAASLITDSVITAGGGANA